MFRVLMATAMLMALPTVLQAGQQARDYAAEARRNPGDAVEGRPGYVWAYDRGWSQVEKVKPVVQVLTSAPSCDPLPNAYTDPDAMLACVLASMNEPPQDLPSFDVGRVYTHVYPERQMMVLSVTRTIDGRVVVTGQIVKDSDAATVGSVFAFVVTVESGVWRR